MLTIHHLHVSQSERLLWLCEELAIPYTLKTYNRAPLIAPPEYKALHPSGSAPVIQDSDGDLTLAESAACVEYICKKHGGGRLFPGVGDEGWTDFLYWFHWSNGTLQPALGRPMITKAAGLSDDHYLAELFKDKIARSLAMLDARLKEAEWLAGKEFTAADVMVVFSLTTMRYYNPYSLEGYEGILGYLKRVHGREAYRKALAKGDPGMELVLGAEPPKAAA
ncbi:glutathione S-transferase [Lasiosphaeris hirsuta]|uniref:Glutathione S-transferase n=1 Tax=Lasiosphaeris hirsuta TaxID=260670 RepID=A0AA40A3N0_9PEZI|nr:glutathione S-transferase [Lasiosphaeris hirsuta]